MPSGYTDDMAILTAHGEWGKVEAPEAKSWAPLPYT